ncbi:hypothetical protein HOE37_06710 [Candidatus Woesearchaeota archaeon]|jgi:hypothetical protein|nr:hypothetical protein [Candidatus Woesearchaeota archaeon]
MQLPNLELLLLKLTFEQKEVISALYETDPDFLLEDIETGNVDMFMACCTLAIYNGEKLIEVLWNDQDEFYTFMYKFMVIVGVFNYKTFCGILEPLKVETSPLSYKKFKKYCEEVLHHDFSRKTVEKGKMPFDQKEEDSDKKISDFWNKKPNTEE